ncbi:MAG: transposase [Brevinematia bacterium]
MKGIAIGYWQGGSVWVVGVNVGRAYSDEGRLLKEQIMEYGLCGLREGVKIIGDRLYGRRASLIEELEKVGYEPVCVAGGTMRKRVKAEGRVRTDERVKRYKDILKRRYRIEQVFCVVKEVCGSYLSVESEKVVRLMLLCMFVL